MAEENKSLGRTRDGIEITEELIEKWVAEAERGYDLSQLRVRARRSVVALDLQLDLDAYWPLLERAEAEGVTPAAKAMRLIRAGLGLE